VQWHEFTAIGRAFNAYRAAPHKQPP
jgi:hypothetical protein